MKLDIINPGTLAAPRGFSHGVRGTGSVLFIAGQIGWDASACIVSDDFVAQFARALDNVLEVLKAAGGTPAQIGRLTIYVVDKEEYLARAREVGEVYRERMGRHFPAMSLVEVRSLLEARARLEIEATAIL